MKSSDAGMQGCKDAKIQESRDTEMHGGCIFVSLHPCIYLKIAYE